MTSDRASQTAEYMAFYRALESGRPARDRLFRDPFAIHFLRPSLRRAVSFSRVPLLGSLVAWYADRRLPGARTSGVARTRLIDEALAQAVQGGLGQAVILGAGFDCRAYRLPSLAATAVFEVDHPATLSRKQERLRRALPQTPENVRFVPMDFNRQSLPEALAQAGLDLHRPAVFLWEGVTNYLLPPAVESVLRFVAQGTPGSRLIFTYVDRRALDGSAHFEDAPALLRAVERLGEPWTFGLHPEELPSYLQAHGLRLERDAGVREYRRQCFGRDGQQMKGYDFYHLAIADLADLPGAGMSVRVGSAREALARSGPDA